MWSSGEWLVSSFRLQHDAGKEPQNESGKPVSRWLLSQLACPISSRYLQDAPSHWYPDYVSRPAVAWQAVSHVALVLHSFVMGTLELCPSQGP